MLTQRMRCVAAFVPSGSKVADIGCDHAYVSIYLCEQGISNQVIAMDVRRGPLDIAGANVHKAGLDGKIELRLSDGLQKLTPGEVDTVVIAGMGGLLVRDILSAGKDVVNELQTMVLQPQSEISEVRKYVRSHGFEITDEAMIWDKNKPYFAMQCKKSDCVFLPDWQEIEYQYGGVLLKHRDEGLKEYLLWEQRHLEMLVARLEAQTGQKAEKRLLELRDSLEYNRQALAYFKE